MRNVITIARKELNTYFQSPIAYILIAAFAAMFGYFFWSLVYFFVRASTQAQMTGRAMPMNLNELVIREGGRIYLAKDALTRPEHFRAMEPRLDEFLRVRRLWDPQARIRSAQSVRLFGW